MLFGFMQNFGINLSIKSIESKKKYIIKKYSSKNSFFWKTRSDQLQTSKKFSSSKIFSSTETEGV